MMHQSSGQATAVNKDLGKIGSLIESSLLHDWSIKIEYAIQSGPDSVTWIKWDKTFFAIKDPAEVLEEIVACCKNNPHCSMKMTCERFMPECQLIYYIN